MELAAVGRQWRMTPRALTRLGLVSDMTKYILLALLVPATIYPGVGAFNFMVLTTPAGAILATAMFWSSWDESRNVPIPVML